MMSIWMQGMMKKDRHKCGGLSVQSKRDNAADVMQSSINLGLVLTIDESTSKRRAWRPIQPTTTCLQRQSRLHDCIDDAPKRQLEESMEAARATSRVESNAPTGRVRLRQMPRLQRQPAPSGSKGTCKGETPRVFDEKGRKHTLQSI